MNLRAETGQMFRGVPLGDARRFGDLWQLEVREQADVLPRLARHVRVRDTERNPNEIARPELDDAALGQQGPAAPDLVLDLVGVESAAVPPLFAGCDTDHAE